jgi:hypothetical protein
VSEPLAIDLCCGLDEPKFGHGANVPIEQLVARRAEHPKHVPLGIADKRPCAVSGELRPMCNLEDTCLSAAFAGGRDIRVSPFHPVELGVPIRAARIVAQLTRRISASPYSAQLARCLARTIGGTISLIGARRRDVKVFAAARAILSGGRDVGLLASPATASATRATLRTIELVRPYGLKRCGAISTGQIIHSGPVA